MKKYIKFCLFLIVALITIETINLSRFFIGYIQAGCFLIFVSSIFLIIAAITLLGGIINE